MKKIISIFTLVVVLCMTCSFTAMAADCNFSITASTTAGEPGDVVRLVIKLDSNPGIANYTNVVKFDSDAFERIDIVEENEDGDEVSYQIKTSWGDLTVNDAIAGSTYFVYVGSSNKTGKTVATIDYKIKDTAVNGTYNFTIECEEAFNASFQNVTIEKATSSDITITGGVEGGSGSTDIIVDEEDFTSATEGSYTSADVTSGDVKVDGDVIATMGEGGKIHTYFNKNATGEVLQAGEYGIEATINGKTFRFPGKTAVSADKAWAIKLVIPTGKFSDGVAASVENITAYTID